jgi:hypothetical protein
VHVARIGETRKSYTILDGKPDGKRSLRRPGCRVEGNIRIDLRGTEWEILEWMHLAQNRDQWWDLVNTVKEPSDSKKR